MAQDGDEGHNQPTNEANSRGGPKSAAGKTISSRNAIRHGITSISPIAGGESEEDWLAFLSGIREVLQPIGALEDEIAQNIAIALWQKRRIVRAASGYIDVRLGIIEDSKSPSDPMSAAELALEKREVDLDQVLHVLESIEGLDDDALTEAAFDSTWVVLQLCPANTAKREQVARILPTEWPSLAVGLRGLIADLAKLNQISGDDLLQSAIMFSERIAARIHRREQRNDARLRTASIPGPQELDLLIRYDAHHDRSIAKNLQHLELLQRLRMGQDVPPPTRIQIDTDAAPAG